MPPTGLDTAALTALKPLLVMNPRSANGSTGRQWTKLEAEAREVLGELTVARTERPLHATELVRAGLKAGHRLVFAIGGDGTLNEVVNGFFDADGRPIAPDAQLGLLPRGTGGDFKRTAGIPVDWRASLRHAAQSVPRPIDVGRVRFRAADGSTGTRMFINECSTGVSAAVVERVNRSSKALGGLLTFYLASFRTIGGWKDVDLQVSLDGAPAETLPTTVYAIANGQFFGGGMHVAPGADLSDGRFSLTHWRAYTLFDFVFRAGGIYSGAHVRWDRTRQFSSSKVRVESATPLAVETDGEIVGTLPIEAEVLPGVVLFRG